MSAYREGEKITFINCANINVPSSQMWHYDPVSKIVDIMSIFSYCELAEPFCLFHPNLQWRGYQWDNMIGTSNTTKEILVRNVRFYNNK